MTDLDLLLKSQAGKQKARKQFSWWDQKGSQRCNNWKRIFLPQPNAPTVCTTDSGGLEVFYSHLSFLYRQGLTQSLYPGDP